MFTARLKLWAIQLKVLTSSSARRDFPPVARRCTLAPSLITDLLITDYFP